jgi:hypothetical protein
MLVKLHKSYCHPERSRRVLPVVIALEWTPNLRQPVKP